MTKNFLFELGCEELPAKGLQRLSELVGTAITQGLSKAEITFGDVHYFATPRRLSVLIQDVIEQQPSRQIERRGPDITKAYDTKGQPTAAAQGFARSCGVEVKDLQTLEMPEGQWLVYRATQPGKPTEEVLPEIVQQAFANLTHSRTMRWGAGEQSFLRPVHWIAALYGDAILNLQLFGLTAGRHSQGHRNYTQALTLAKPGTYQETLLQGKVLSDFNERKQNIVQQIETLCEKHQAKPIMPDDLLDEVTGLVEWPRALKVPFAERYLNIPKEALITAMQHHQKCFAVTDTQGHLLPWFITVANLESTAPEFVIKGNERVMRARLSDAEFFYQVDLKQKLSDHVQDLAKITFQKQLGSLLDKSLRVAAISKNIAKHLQIDVASADEAARLAKADLLTSLVGEFPELQGIMGDYYARHEGKAPEIAQAIREHYLPRFAGDDLPQSALGCSVALADRIDTLVGLFGLQQIPRGDKDPFGLKRSALGIVRILVEKELDLDLNALIQLGKTHYGDLFKKIDIDNALIPFIQERFKSWCLEQGFLLDEFNAVIARQTTHLYDASKRLKALQAFRPLPAALALAAAHKRVNNILKSQSDSINTNVNPDLFAAGAESELAKVIQSVEEKTAPWQQHARYTDILNTLAELQGPVDRFFDSVMVMDENIAVRQNRLALLARLHALLMQVADISLLKIS